MQYMLFNLDMLDNNNNNNNHNNNNNNNNNSHNNESISYEVHKTE